MSDLKVGIIRAVQQFYSKADYSGIGLKEVRARYGNAAAFGEAVRRKRKPKKTPKKKSWPY